MTYNTGSLTEVARQGGRDPDARQKYPVQVNGWIERMKFGRASDEMRCIEYDDRFVRMDVFVLIGSICFLLVCLPCFFSVLLAFSMTFHSHINGGLDFSTGLV